MILYPTETVYGIGVNPFNPAAVRRLFAAKGRDERRVSAWLVRSIEDMHRFATLSDVAERLAKTFLPGPLTLVLPAKDTVPSDMQSEQGSIGLRVSSDPYAQALISDFFAEYNAPVTCTSANVTGKKTEATVPKILEQFRTYQPDFTGFTEVIDGGARAGQPSTVVGVIGSNVSIYRSGAISEAVILEALNQNFSQRD